jgi:hypothetical protein
MSPADRRKPLASSRSSGPDHLGAYLKIEAEALFFNRRYLAAEEASIITSPGL